MITGTVTPDDHLAAQRLHRQKHSHFAYAAGAAALLLGLWAWFLASGLSGLLLAAMGAGAILGELATSRWVLPRRIRKLHQQQKDFAHPFTYSWNADTIEGRGISGQSKRPWAWYHKVREDENVVLLYHNDNVFEMLPKRWFADPQILAEFIALARNAKKT